MEDILLEINRRWLHGGDRISRFAYSPVPDETVPGGIGGVLCDRSRDHRRRSSASAALPRFGDLGARAAEARTCARRPAAIAAETLSRYARDVPVRAALPARSTNAPPVRPSSSAQPVLPMTNGRARPLLNLGQDGEATWPIAGALANRDDTNRGQHYEAGFRNTAVGPWSDPPNMAAIVPIKSNIARHSQPECSSPASAPGSSLTACIAGLPGIGRGPDRGGRIGECSSL